MPDGTGDLFIDPSEGLPHLARLAENTRQVFTDVIEALSTLERCPWGKNVRVRIRAVDQHEQHQLEASGIEGTSCGGALAVGLYSLWADESLENGLVTSFALTPGIDAARRVTHIETDLGDVGVDHGVMTMSLAPTRLATYRLDISTR